MTLRHMKIYVTVFQHCNITRAAEELHLAQPSVSLAVKELEEYYGVQLFERRGRRILPTEAGREFYGYALHIASLFDEMETRIKNWDKHRDAAHRYQHHHRHAYIAGFAAPLSKAVSGSADRDRNQ
ncbi:MAG: LysR family transcriptional regulator [Anaerosacchariphilus sp.]